MSIYGADQEACPACKFEGFAFTFDAQDDDALTLEDRECCECGHVVTDAEMAAMITPRVQDRADREYSGENW